MDEATSDDGDLKVGKLGMGSCLSISVFVSPIVTYCNVLKIKETF